MATISATMVRDLREKTGAGMMDCKAALEATAGDEEAAVDWLRKKGIAKAAKKADRVAADGLIGVAREGTKGVLVEVNSETDFVARNGLFQGLVKMIAQVALNVGANADAIKAAKAGSITVTEAIADTVLIAYQSTLQQIIAVLHVRLAPFLLDNIADVIRLPVRLNVGIPHPVVGVVA